MRFLRLGFFVSFVVLICSMSSAFAEDVLLDTTEKKISYLLGFFSSKEVADAGFSPDGSLILRAMNDVAAKTDLAISHEEQHKIKNLISSMSREMENARAREAAIHAAESFFAENAQREGVVQTASGLQYEILQSGKGKAPSNTDIVQVHYQGSFLDGQIFETTLTSGEPAEFPVNGVIAGWTEVLPLMQEGAKWKVYIPSRLAYPNGTRTIPPGSALVFELELLEVLN